MPIVVASIDVPAAAAAVWEDLERLELHSEWMSDAQGVEFDGSRRRGEGTRMRVHTSVGPLSTTDIIEFTAWEPPHRMAVRHRGLVRGWGEFRLEPVAGGTRVVWREELTFPWYLGGVLTAVAAAPVLRRIWQRNLQRFRARF